MRMLVVPKVHAPEEVEAVLREIAFRHATEQIPIGDRVDFYDQIIVDQYRLGHPTFCCHSSPALDDWRTLFETQKDQGVLPALNDLNRGFIGPHQLESAVHATSLKTCLMSIVEIFGEAEGMNWLRNICLRSQLVHEVEESMLPEFAVTPKTMFFTIEGVMYRCCDNDAVAIGHGLIRQIFRQAHTVRHLGTKATLLGVEVFGPKFLAFIQRPPDT